MSKAPNPVLLRESLGGTSKRYDADHADALLAYPGTVWSAVADETPVRKEAPAAEAVTADDTTPKKKR